MGNDLATPDYWENVWHEAALPRVLHPVKNPFEGRLMRLFKKHLPRGGRALEIGCAGSPWLAFFSQELGADIWGIDYSTTGLEVCRKNLALQNLSAHLILGNFIEEKLESDYFRVVFSAGVVEHYEDPTPLFKKAFEVLEPGGILATVIPNVAGVFGWVQKHMDRSVYDVHMPFTTAQLDRFQKSVGLEAVLPTRPFGVFSLGMMNWTRAYQRCAPRLRKPLAYTLQWTDRLTGWSTWWAEGLLDSSWTSPYLVSLYKKPSSRT